MPPSTPIDLRLTATLAAQDGVISRGQASRFGLSARAIDYRLSIGRWQRLLPAVYVASNGTVTRRQMLIGAQLHGGRQSAIDGIDACHFHGVRVIRPEPGVVHLVVPEGLPTRSRGFVVVRRSSAPIDVVTTERLRYVSAPIAVVAAARQLTSDRAVLALLSDAVQRRVVTYDQLVVAHVRNARRNAGPTDRALPHLAAGIQSAPEADFRRLAEASLILPPLLYNPLLRLPGGQVVSPDALAVDAGLVHETNGRGPHERDDLFEDMQYRHDVLTAAGLIVMHNPPRRLAVAGRQALAQFEAAYLRYAGRGLPAGVELIRPAA